MRLVDLSHTIEPGMPLFSDSAPQPRITPWMSHADSAQTGAYEGTTCELTEVAMITSAGTYMDSPYHFHPDRDTIDRLTLDQLVLPGVVVDCTNAPRAIGPDVLSGVDVAGRAVLFHTGWDRYWGEPRYHEHPYLTGGAARALLEGGAKLAGVDFLVIDDTSDPTRPVHVTLLGADILIVENLTNLAALPPEGFLFHAAPARVRGAAAFPVRAYAAITQEDSP
ncbi:MAG: cyclase family protein [Chloroflexi bacterium]|nr:cyclase family protein [Chloroflexota bacterium]